MFYTEIQDFPFNNIRQKPLCNRVLISATQRSFYLDFSHIFFPIKIFHNPRNGLRHIPVHVGIIPAILDGFQKGYDLVADALAVQLVEVALVVGGVFVANLKELVCHQEPVLPSMAAIALASPDMPGISEHARAVQPSRLLSSTTGGLGAMAEVSS